MESVCHKTVDRLYEPTVLIIIQLLMFYFRKVKLIEISVADPMAVLAVLHYSGPALGMYFIP
jgi:hypothetical protein